MKNVQVVRIADDTAVDYGYSDPGAIVPEFPGDVGIDCGSREIQVGLHIVIQTETFGVTRKTLTDRFVTSLFDMASMYAWGIVLGLVDRPDFDFEAAGEWLHWMFSPGS